MYVCICHSVTDRQIREAAAGGAATLEELQHLLGIGSSCGKCLSCACQVLDEAVSDGAPGGACPGPYTPAFA
jgi:bacterioferritin-associated ferredoxin